MPIKSLTIENVGAFSGKHDFLLPAVCLIQGGNAAGKTSLQESIKYVGDRGHDPDMIHGAAEAGDIVITMADGHQMRARITRTETQRAWKAPDSKRWVVNRAYIDDVCNALAFDPLRFLDKEPGEQAQELLRLVSLPPCASEILGAIGDLNGCGLLGNVNIDTTDALQSIEAVYKNAYEERTRLNTTADSLEKHVAELRRTLPADSDVNWVARVAEVSKARKYAQDQLQERIAGANKAFQEGKSEASNIRGTAHESANNEYEKAVRIAEEKRAASKEAADAIFNSAVEVARASAQTTADDARQSIAPTIDNLTADLASAELLASQEQQAKGTRAAIEKAAAEAQEKRKAWAAHNAAVENLRKLRASLADRLPIKGVTVRDGRIVREQDGGMVPLKKWNTADQRKLALRVGMLIGQKAGFVVVDHVESFDKQQRAALLATCSKYAEENGIQFILASVDPYTEKPGPMRVVDGSTGGK